MLPRSRLTGCFLSIVFIICSAISAHSQSTGGTCNDIHVYASVLNDKKQVVGGLLDSDFSAELNGAPTEVKNVDYNVTRHRAALLVDHSGSMLDVWPAVYEAAAQFVRQFPAGLSVSVVTFDNRIVELVPFTTNRTTIPDSLKSFLQNNPPKGRTRLFDAIDIASNRLSPGAVGDLIYVITDAGDNSSNQTDKIKKRLINSHLRLFAVILSDTNPKTPEERTGPVSLHELIEQTGGTYIDWYVERPEKKLAQKEALQISEGTRWLVQNMTDEYDLTLHSLKPLPSKVKIKLKVKVKRLAAEDASKFRVITQPVIATGCP